jgi:hypothetical protein
MKGKPSLAILIGEKLSKKKMSEDGDDAGEGRLEAMKGFIAAVKDGDEEAALEEFLNLQSLCGDED